MPFEDFREYLAYLESEDELRRIPERSTHTLKLLWLPRSQWKREGQAYTLKM